MSRVACWAPSQSGSDLALRSCGLRAGRGAYPSSKLAPGAGGDPRVLAGHGSCGTAPRPGHFCLILVDGRGRDGTCFDTARRLPACTPGPRRRRVGARWPNRSSPSPGGMAGLGLKCCARDPSAPSSLGRLHIADLPADVDHAKGSGEDDGQAPGRGAVQCWTGLRREPHGRCLPARKARHRRVTRRPAFRSGQPATASPHSGGPTVDRRAGQSTARTAETNSDPGMQRS